MIKDTQTQIDLLKAGRGLVEIADRLTMADADRHAVSNEIGAYANVVLAVLQRMIETPVHATIDINDPRYSVTDPDKVDAGPKLHVSYTNYRGEPAVRLISPDGLWFGTTEWHPEPGWLLRCYDWDKTAWRDYALADCDFSAGTSQTLGYVNVYRDEDGDIELGSTDLDDTAEDLLLTDADKQGYQPELEYVGRAEVRLIKTPGKKDPT